ncbi:MAG: DUF58 domain-containing protein [Alphaproteobacteria bacterium]|nr:DUF58 domain-containing protein [Alphaproteobacteria bacterium]
METFIDPKTLARVKDMPLIAKTVADGFLHGLHQSRQRGVGIEFSQYRPYGDGDDLSRIDWKLFARSDRYFVREAERESEIAIWFLLDASGSMAVSSEPQAGNTRWSKLDYAAHLIATLSYLAYGQGDRIGFMALSSNRQHIVPLGSGDQHWSAILLELARVKAGAYFPKKEMIDAMLKSLQQPGMVVMVSDFFEHGTELLDLTKSLAVGKTELVAIQLTSADEETFPYKGAVRFEDAETGEQVLVSARNARDTYLEAKTAFQRNLEDQLLRQSVDLTTLNIDEPLDQALYDFLKNRAKVTG